MTELTEILSILTHQRATLSREQACAAMQTILEDTQHALPDEQIKTFLTALAARDVTGRIREEQVGNLASRIAAYGLVRQALLERQRAFRRLPGLVADGRDMGTVIFPDAPLKIFLIADVVSRAQRRCKQLKKKGFSANLANLLKDIEARDERDRARLAAPLVAAADAVTVDSSSLSIDETVKVVLDLWSRSGAQKTK